ncbi:hypothetical protein JIN85_00710 [Luteolibacter pohnpeiensis]|uniref:Uncharacterized protein n=1 Tax=Luteolibacter pohnpeiensis TaxID=454153 RepID=A0A934VPE5_9BACT|nr:hypothetical protein [Luteolibacter pohnpeiensis]MBK1880911.1 hypothetical protein [Luteolibacter pohnpeiensis]
MDPQAAIAAVSGSQLEAVAWSAWSSSDPIAALNAAVEQNPEQLNAVASGIGEFHPNWLMEHFDDIPDESKPAALQGLAKWDDVEDAEKVLTFLTDHGFGIPSKMLMLLTNRDPWAAYAWVMENGKSGSNGMYTDAFRTFAQTLQELDPGLIERFAKLAPPGQMKNRLDDAVFSNLLKSDPEAALKQSMATTAPITRTQRVAQVVQELVHENPDLAFTTVEELLEKNPNALQKGILIKTENSSMSFENPASDAISTMISSLVTADPARLMNTLPEVLDSDFYSSSLYQASSQWARSDLDGYLDWIDNQVDSMVKPQQTHIAIQSLLSTGRYEEAATRSLNSNGSSKKNSNLMNVIMRWSRSSPEAAETWLKNSDLPQDQVQLQLKLIKQLHP